MRVSSSNISTGDINEGLSWWVPPGVTGVEGKDSDWTCRVRWRTVILKTDSRITAIVIGFAKLDALLPCRSPDRMIGGPGSPTLIT